MKRINWRTTGRIIGISAGIGAAVTSLASALLAGCVGGEFLSIAAGEKVMYGMVLTLALITSWSAAKKVPCERLIVAILTAVSYLAIMLILKSILFHGEELMPLWKIGAPILLSIPAGLLASGKKGRRR